MNEEHVLVLIRRYIKFKSNVQRMAYCLELWACDYLKAFEEWRQGYQYVSRYFIPSMKIWTLYSVRIYRYFAKKSLCVI